MDCQRKIQWYTMQKNALNVNEKRSETILKSSTRDNRKAIKCEQFFFHIAYECAAMKAKLSPSIIATMINHNLLHRWSCFLLAGAQLRVHQSNSAEKRQQYIN